MSIISYRPNSCITNQALSEKLTSDIDNQDLKLAKEVVPQQVAGSSLTCVPAGMQDDGQKRVT